MNDRLNVCQVFALLALLVGGPTLSQGAEEESGLFIRLRCDENEQPLALETAIVRFRDKSQGLTVDLVGAIHIADKAYYDALNRRFKTYEAVLYELVAREDPPYETVDRWYLFNLVRLPSGEWIFRRSGRSASRGY